MTSHVNKALAQMDQVTQQNAALVEEAAASADAMHKQAEELAQAVQVFKIDAAHTAAAPSLPREPVLPAAGKALPSAPRTRAVSTPRARAVPAVSAGNGWEEF